MPKMKTNKAASKRFKVTGGGKFKRGRANLRHNLEKRAHAAKKKNGKPDLVHKSMESQVKRLLPTSLC
jgi:large subunit ribosomal protein L35